MILLSFWVVALINEDYETGKRLWTSQEEIQDGEDTPLVEQKSDWAQRFTDTYPRILPTKKEVVNCNHRYFQYNAPYYGYKKTFTVSKQQKKLFSKTTVFRLMRFKTQGYWICKRLTTSITDAETL